jgi:hypothetical protein
MPKAEGDSRVTVGDINGDGYGDLVLANPEDPALQEGTGHLGGQVEIWYGGKGGPDLTQTPTVINQDTAGVPGTGEERDFFGGSLSVGDINGDRYADLAVGAQYEGVGGTPFAGSVTVLYGSAAGLTTKGAKSYHQAAAGVPGTPETQDGFGGAVRLTDLNRDGRAELVVAAPGENTRGALLVLRGTASGPTTKGARSITAAHVGLKETAYGFGAQLAP